MSKDLPQFKAQPFEKVREFIELILTNKAVAPETQLIRLMTYPDGHYRAVFQPDYFILNEGESTPSKSQWNTLKKRLKRHDERIFVFKEHGEMTDESAETPVYYLDFGYFAQ